VTDPLAGAEVLEFRESTTKDAEGRTVVRRLRLLRVNSMKYPLLRVEEDLLRTSQGEQRLRQVAMVGDHVLVKLRQPKMSEADFLQKLGDGAARVRQRMPASGLWLVSFSEPHLDTVPQAVARLRKLEDLVAIVEPDHVLSAQVMPDDASFSQQWALHNTGQSGGVVDADLDATEAWELHTGSRSVLVAVIDTGIQISHPDLAANVWTNPGEIPGNGLDDDGNGYVDDVRGWDYVNWDNDPADDHGHGTHCAGIIGAVGNNAIGVSGVCWEVSLLALKFLNSSGNGYESDAAEATLYAASLGARVTSNSYTGTAWSQILKDALDTAGQAGVLCVAAAGNTGNNIDFFPEYPAAYESPNLISVAATTRTDALASYSNYGALTVDLAAPGSEILSTTLQSGFTLSSGTSMAAPQVAGACALLMSYRPAFSHMQVRDLLLTTVEARPALTGKCVTGGRLNLYNALLAADDILATPTGTLNVAGSVGGPFTPTVQSLTLTNHSGVQRPWTVTCDRPWITLMPTSGTLEPGGSVEVSVLVNAAAQPLLATTHQAFLSITSTSTGRVQARTLALEISATPVFSTLLEEDPGWQRSGEWALWQPQGLGGQPFGNPDPTSGATGSAVFGINLAGNYTVAAGPPQHLTAGPFDLAGHHATRLRYRRWLNVDHQPWVVAAVQVSTNGSTWTTVWQNEFTSPRDASWVQMEHDLSALADGQPTLFIRWVHHVTSPEAYAYSGWNLDDIEIQAVPDQQSLLLLPSDLTEGGAAATATLMVASAASTPLTFTLSSSRPGEELGFPTSVTLAAGQTEASFTITALDDVLMDGSQEVTLTASAVGWPSASATVQVHDDESGTLVLTLPNSLAEGEVTSPQAARLSLAHTAPVPVLVTLGTNRPEKLMLPASVTVPQGQQEVFFAIQALEDDWIDGDQPVQVTASVMNWPTASAVLTHLDNESRELQLQLPTALLEGTTYASGGRLQLQGRLSAALAFSLSPNAPDRLIIPANVVIPAGADHVLFDLTAQENAAADGTQTVLVTAAAPGFASANAQILVHDDEMPALPVQPAPTDGLSPVPLETDLAWSYDPISGGEPDGYDVWFGDAASGLQFISSQVDAYFTLPRLEPGTTYLWRVSARRGGQVRQGPVWTFSTAEVGLLHHFTWDKLPPAAARATPMPVRITARDSWGNAVASFTGAVMIRASTQPGDTTAGAGGMTWFYPLASFYHDARTQSIYTPSEVGGPGLLTALSLDVTRLPGQALKDLTIRLKHTQRSSYPNAERTWESDGWTTVFSETRTLTSLGWNTFSFTTPFAYDGEQNLMVDISFNNNSYSSDGLVRATPTSTPRSLAHRVDSTHGAPTAWSGTTPQGTAGAMLPQIRLARAAVDIPVSQATASPFIQGAWSGTLSVLQAAPAVTLRAVWVENADVEGHSSPLEIVSVNDVTLLPEPLFTGGSSNTIAWNHLGPGYTYELARSLSADFAQAEISGPLTASEVEFSGLADGQTYHYRVRATAAGLTGQWSQPERSTQDATPPVIAVTPGSGAVTLGTQVTLTGSSSDPSGISTLSVNGASVATSNAFASWSLQLPPLTEGWNTFALTASDQAVPPNTRTEMWSILRITDPAGDADGNGIGQLMEHAFHVSGHDAAKALPRSAVLTDPGTGQRRLRLTYRRLLSNPSGLQYQLETSPDMLQWENVTAQAEIVDIIPDADGAAETVTVLLPASAQAVGAQFARVRIIVP
jgi:subtilisin family serine protease